MSANRWVAVILDNKNRTLVSSSPALLQRTAQRLLPADVPTDLRIFVMSTSRGRAGVRDDNWESIHPRDFDTSILQLVEDGCEAVLDLSDSVDLSPASRVRAATSAALGGAWYVTPGLRIPPCPPLRCGRRALVISIVGDSKSVGKTTLASSMAQYLAAKGETVTIVSVERSPLLLPSGRLNQSSDCNTHRAVGLRVVHFQRFGELLPYVPHIADDPKSRFSRLRGVVIVDNSGASVLPVRSHVVIRLGGGTKRPRSARAQDLVIDALGGSIGEAVVLGIRPRGSHRELRTVPYITRNGLANRGTIKCLLLTRHRLRNHTRLLKGLKQARGSHFAVRERECHRPDIARDIALKFLSKNPGAVVLTDHGSVLNNLIAAGFEGSTYRIGYLVSRADLESLVRQMGGVDFPSTRRLARFADVRPLPSKAGTS